MRRGLTAPRHTTAVIMLTMAFDTAGAGLAAQNRVRADSTVPAGTVVGSVVAAETGVPLEGSLVVLEPAPGGAMSPRIGGPPYWESGRVARTDATGAYRFDGLAIGHYRLHVRRLGYRPAMVEIDLRSDATFRLSVGLVVLPIALEPVDVLGSSTVATTPFGANADEAQRARLVAEADRRTRFLASDTRVLTTADLTEAVTLAETDLFRALQRLPSVTTRDDFTAELWTRGARWSDTRVTFDGYPLFSPVHAAGALTGTHPDAVGVAFFHPGVRPAASGEGTAATLELTSRPATQPGVHGLAELSMVSARAAVQRGARDGRGGWMLAARRSYADLIAPLVGTLTNDATLVFPYAFTDLAGRLDVPLGPTSALEVSGLWAEDALRGTVPNLLRANAGRWGNGVFQATLVAPLAGLPARHTAGVSRFNARIVDSVLGAPGVGDPTDPSHRPTRARITYAAFGSVFGPGSGTGWGAGYQFVSQRLRYDGPDPTDYPDDWAGVLQTRGDNTLIALWGERRLKPHARLTMLAGLRFEAGTPAANASAVRLAPRLQAQYLVDEGRFLLSAGYGRYFQYTQAVGPTGPGVGPELHLSEVWVMAGDTVPAIRSDIATAGAEYWTDDGWTAALNLYWRRASGVAVPDPTPGKFESGRPLFVPALAVSRGAEVSLRKLAGRWTASLSLATGRSELRASGHEYPAPADRHRVLHATVLVRARQGLHLGAALTAASGAPFTRFVASPAPCYSNCPPIEGNPYPYSESAGGARAPGYATVDLLLDWTRAQRTWSWGVFLQLRNALNATTPITYAGSFDRCSTAQPPLEVQVRPGMCDHYALRFPQLPLVGVRVVF